MNLDREDHELQLRQMIRATLAATLDGEFSTHTDFPYFSTRSSYDMFTEIDGLPLFPERFPEVFSRWAGLEAGKQIGREDILVLDLETTGLGRGQTLAFMIGLGYYEDGRYVVEQLFLPEPEAEANSFDRLIELVSEKSVLITFNGKTFDVPILESRLLYHHIWLDLRSLTHIDLLHIARRLWKNKIPSCALETIEFYILGHIREKELDIEGGLIPQTYFQYLINGDAELMRRVFLHNQLDVLHTAALFTLICDLAGYPQEQGFNQRIDYHALARLYLSQGDRETARAILTDLLAQNILSGDIACELGLINKQEGDAEAAASCFALASSLGHPGGRLEQAKLLEKRKEYGEALDLSEKLLHWHLGLPRINARQVGELEKRILRLRRKLGIMGF